MISAVLADDHPIVRQGLRTLLENEDHCRVIGEASDGLTAIELIERLQPDVAILDVQLPDLNGLEVARRVRQRSSRTRVIMLSMHSDEPFVLDALRHGASGYVLKDSATTELLQAVHAVMRGERYLSRSLAQMAFESYAQRANLDSGPIDRYDLLTAREREVLQLAAQGKSNDEIGDRLSISPRTAETHRANLMRKLSLKSQTDLVHYALGRGTVRKPD